jgi:hypothetical protein
MGKFIATLADESLSTLPDAKQEEVKLILGRFSGFQMALADDMDLGLMLDSLNASLVDYPDTLRLVHALPGVERVLNRFGYSAYL